MTDAVTNALISSGGMGVVAGVLLLLHREALKTFRTELAADREACEIRHNRVMDKLDDIEGYVR